MGRATVLWFSGVMGWTWCWKNWKAWRAVALSWVVEGEEKLFWISERKAGGRAEVFI